jgi:integrase
MGRRAAPPRVYQDSIHGEIYQYSFTVRGKRYRGSTGSRDFAEATAKAEALWVDAHRGKEPRRRIPNRQRDSASSPLDALFALFIDSIAGKKSDGYVVKMESHFRAHFSGRWTRIDELTGPALELYASERLREITRLGRPTSTVTVHKELTTISRFLRWARKTGHLEEVPVFERVKAVSDYTPPDYSAEQTKQLLAALPDRLSHSKRQPVREFFTVQWAQAFRPDAELGSLRWMDISLSRREMTVRQSQDKAREGRTISMAPETYRILSKMAKDAQPIPTALIFGRHNFRASLEKAADSLGLPRPTRHNLRHFRLTELGHSKETAVGALKYFAGHKLLATTDRYVRSRTKATKDMLDGLRKRRAK